jgi:hypothetical protein
VITVICTVCQKEYTFDESIIPPDLDMLECKICKNQFPLIPDWENSHFVPAYDTQSANGNGTYESDFAEDFPIELDGTGCSFDMEGSRNIDKTDSCSNQVPAELEEGDAYIELIDVVENHESPTRETVLTNDESPTGSHQDYHLLSKNKRDEQGQVMDDDNLSFSAHRFRMLNAKRKRSERRRLLFFFVALVGLVLSGYFVYLIL